ncbi:MAG: hypothetical protein CMH55_03580 [Myxococcales bacterium]|nr:hypothetical protein [Myxococcales bacterium]
MTAYLGFALIFASTIDVQAKDLRLDKDGTLFARGEVVIRWRGRVFQANEARLDRENQSVTLVGGVNTEESGAVLRCDALELRAGQIHAQQVDLSLRDGGGQVLARARAGSVRQMGANKHLREVDLTICRCDEPPWSFAAARVDVLGDRHRVVLSWPVLRIRQVPVLVLPWWSLPLGRRSSGLLAPVTRYDARDGLRVGLPVYWAGARWWDATFTGGWVQSRGLWGRGEVRAKPTKGAKTQLEFETLEGRWLGEVAHYDPAPAREWNIHGLLASDADAFPDLAVLAARRQLPAIDLRQRLRLGEEWAGLSLSTWHGRRNGSLWTGPLTHGVSTDLDLHLIGQQSALHGRLGLNSKPAHPLPQDLAPYGSIYGSAGGTLPPYIGWQSSGWAELGSTARVGAAVSLYTALSNGRGTWLKPSIEGRVQRLPELSVQGLQAPWSGVSGEHLRIGFEARQAGFLQRYGLMLGRRHLVAEGGPSIETTASSGLLLDWLGSWKRKRWAFTTRWVLDSADLAPAVVTGFYLLRDARGRERFRVSYQRRDLGRDLTLDLDPALGLSRHLGRQEDHVLYEDLSGRVSWESGRVQLEASAAFRPTTSSLRLLSAVLGYRSPCDCWGVAVEAGWAGDIALADETYGAPIVGLGFSGGSSRPKILERLTEAGLDR